MSRKPDIFLSELKVKNKAVKVLAALMILGGDGRLSNNTGGGTAAGRKRGGRKLSADLYRRAGSGNHVVPGPSTAGGVVFLVCRAVAAGRAGTSQ